MEINILGSNREPLFSVAEQQLYDMRQAHVLVTDPRRTRPSWFDGRFLAAQDLANEQNYFLVRQNDLGRAGGTGVIEGLMVTEVADNKTNALLLRIDAGYGFTDTGEMVVLPECLDIDPANIPEMQRLDAAFGIQKIPNESGRSRTGLYIIALRPVEWTANQISAYPTSLTGERTVQDGDIIEGVVISLVPYADNGTDDWQKRRAAVARDIFLNGRDRGLASGTLPLAMVALRGNQVVWLDPYMIRRDAGAERPVGMDFGFGQRALREAQLLQYDNHLIDIINIVDGNGFAAATWFNSLPPVGRLPAQAVNGDTLTHQFFPPTVKVEFSFVPEDEIPALVEESLLLPPLDLEASAETLAGLSVIILAPVEHEKFVKNYIKLAGRTIKLSSPVKELKGNTRALEISVNYQRQDELVEQFTEKTILEASMDWKGLIKSAQEKKLFWYVRRRHLPVAANIAGAAVNATNPEFADSYKFYRLLQENNKLNELWNKVLKNAEPEVKILLKRFTEQRMIKQPHLMMSMLSEATAKENATTEDIIKALAPVVNPDLGKGLALLATSDNALSKSLAQDSVAGSGVLAEVDRMIREAPDDKQAEVVTAVKEAVRKTGKKPAVFAQSVAELNTKYKGKLS